MLSKSSVIRQFLPPFEHQEASWYCLEGVSHFLEDESLSLDVPQPFVFEYLYESLGHYPFFFFYGS